MYFTTVESILLARTINYLGYKARNSVMLNSQNGS